MIRLLILAATTAAAAAAITTKALPAKKEPPCEPVQAPENNSSEAVCVMNEPTAKAYGMDYMYV